ncbi:MAG: PKD domain-containing protein [Bacteroidetes bacterium]|nr:PKD domain-containing protein [Bacteroidota bacterium]
MKLVYSLLLALFLSIGAQAQNCIWSASVGPNNTVVFTPPLGFTNPQFYAEWDLGDGSIIHAPVSPITYSYASPNNYIICLTIFDSTNGQAVCGFCDSISVGGCYITYTQTGTQFVFTSSSSNPGSVYSWSFGDGSAGTGQTVSHPYNGIGNYTVTMTELDSSGNVICSSTIIVSTQAGSTCNFTYGQPNPVTAPGTYTFVGSAGVNPNFVWDFGDGTSGIGPNATHTYTQSGTYTVCMTSYTLLDTCVTCNNIIVSLTPPSCSFSSFPDSVNSSQMYFNAWGVFVNNIINWTYGDGTSGTGQFSTHTYNASGVYTVCMNEIDFVTGLTVCTYCDSVYVGGSTNCNFTVNSNGTFGSPAVFVASTAPVGSVYYWDFGDGSPIITGQTVTHVYAAPGIYNACLSIGFQGAIVCMTCQPVNISGSNPGCQANFVSVSVGLNAYFIDQSVVNPPNVPPLPSPVFYSWNFGDGNSSTLQFPNHQYSNPGTYVVCLVVSTVGCSSTYCDSIVIDTTINNPIGCNAFFVFTQLSPYNLVGVNLSSGNNLNFSWDFGDGSPLVGGAYPSHQYASTGSYVVCLTVSDFFGCSDTYCDTLTVDSLGNIVYRSATSGFVLNIYSPAYVTSGIDDITPTNAQLFPNPAHSNLIVKWSAEVSNELSYKVVSVDGRTVLNGSLTRDVNSIDVATLSPGFYLLQVQNANGSMETKPFVKQ